MFTRRIMLGSALTATGVWFTLGLVRTWGRWKAADGKSRAAATVGAAVGGV